MYALIKYVEDDVYQVCLENMLKFKRNVVMGKCWGHYYPARILTRAGISILVNVLLNKYYICYSFIDNYECLENL